MQLIKKEEAMKLLEQNRKHYLWNKHFSRWTEKDVENLRSGVNILYGNVLKERKPKVRSVKQMTIVKTYPAHIPGQPVLVITPTGEKKTFDSVVQAAKDTGFTRNAIYNLVNGRYAQSFGYKFQKIAI